MTVLGSISALVLLLLAFWIRAAGTAVSRLPRADVLRDAAEGVTGAEDLGELLEEREQIAPAVGAVASGLLIVSSVLAVVVLVRGEPSVTTLGGALGVGLVAFLLGDLVPRQLGRHRPRPIAYRSAWLLRTAVLTGSWANELLPEPENPVAYVEEEPEDESDEQERELIDSVLEFSETIVREVMTPRPDMITIPFTASVEELIEVASEEGFSRVPVTSDGDIVGMIIVKDLLPLITDSSRPASIGELMRPAEFVPETKLVSALLAEMQESHTHQMIVVDEYGDVVGLVTIEDLLEELVGEIADETDLEETLIQVGPDGWDVDARLPVDDLEEITGVELPDEEWDTVGGLLLGLAERVPEEGETFTYERLLFRVTGMQGRRVARVRVTLTDEIETV